MPAPIRIGLSGYAYKPWQGEGRFYPPELKQREFFAFYASRFRAVEMDGTWYRMPSENAVAQWVAQCPPDFRYTFKVHRDVTHMKRLKEGSVESLEFMLKRLKPALDAGVVGCVYFQFPPNFRRTDDRLETFVAKLPKGVPFACEFRHESWKTDEVRDILARHGVATVASDAEEWELIRQDTADFAYARLRRESYDDDQLAEWAKWFTERAAENKPVYVFMKHEDEGSPWIDADRLLALL